ncbi:MAG TPA: hypothetical protein VM888_12960, partial [Chitinophagaceae bacterium]|nr:hypothetical protein [Chitinophagaceae bacterium]
MKTNLLLLGSLLLSCFYVQAQSKVFKEVSDEISSQIKTIRQDDALVGYLVFTQLEKASEDSFNYKLTIMDENLNDIGTVNFRDEYLQLQSVSFEQDIICLAYLKSNVIDKKFKNRKAYNAAIPTAKNAIVTQFLNLDGKIINRNSVPATIDMSKTTIAYTGDKLMTNSKLKQEIQVRNIAQKGFALFYGDDEDNHLSVYDVNGKQLWKKKISQIAKAYYLMASNEEIYLLSKKEDKNLEGGYEFAGYDFKGNTNYDKYVLKDKSGNSLKIIGVGNDPATNKPYMTGTILNPSIRGLYMVKDVTKGPYLGVFTINVNGPKKGDIKETFSYWNNGAYSTITERGKFAESEAYSLLSQSFKDYNGDTYFVGSSVIKRPKWGSIASSVILSPLIVV